MNTERISIEFVTDRSNDHMLGEIETGTRERDTT